MKNAVKQIIGSFEDIGKDIARETIKVPTDIAGKAMESMGATGSQGTNGQSTPASKVPTEGAIGEMDKTKDMSARRNFARQALAQFAGQKQREPTVQERQEQEKRQTDEQKKQQEVAQKKELKPMTYKAKRGNLHGSKGQKANTEMSKNTRSD